MRGEHPILDILEDELIRLHNLVYRGKKGYEAMSAIQKIHSHLFEISRHHHQELMPSRIKSIENSIAELCFTGVSEQKGEDK